MVPVQVRSLFFSLKLLLPTSCNTIHYNTSKTMLKIILVSFLLVLVVLPVQVALAGDAYSVELPPLPYGYTALKPFISKQTLQVHHDKHHAKYVATTKSMIAGTKLEGKSLKEIILQAHKDKNQGLYNNAAQSWNHAFYWKCMSPSGGKEPIKHEQLYKLLIKSFGSFENFQSEFAAAGNTAFGSGWAWLVYDGSTGKLIITKTIGADNPMALNKKWIPIMTMDVWEHAYYLDYQNLRPSYVDVFLKKLVNWKFVAKNLEEAMSS
jgi:Fe-Mn family superoxide dismutase